MSARSSTPDLFSSASATEHVPPSPAIASSPRHVLPADLPNAIKHLDDGELDHLLSAVLAEQRRRGKKPSASVEGARRDHKGETASPTLTRGRINAVRAAFKAGVTPSRIARQFGLSKSDVTKALKPDARSGEG